MAAMNQRIGVRNRDFWVIRVVNTSDANIGCEASISPKIHRADASGLVGQRGLKKKFISSPVGSSKLLLLNHFDTASHNTTRPYHDV